MLAAFAVLLVAIGAMTYTMWRAVDEPPPLLTARHGAGGGLLGDVAFVVGGVGSEGSLLATVEALGAGGTRWGAVAPLAFAVRSPAVAGSGEVLYVIGGFTGDDDASATDVVQVYDPGSDSWHLATPAPVAVGGAAALGLDERVYLFGGRNAQGDSAGAFVYSPRRDSWEELAPLPTARSEMAAAWLEGRVHLIGGAQVGAATPVAGTAHEAFDPASGEWETLAPLPAGRLGAAAVTLGGCLLLAGGVTPDGQPSDAALAYTPGATGWRTAGLQADAEPLAARFGQVTLGRPNGELLLIGGREASGGEVQAVVQRLRLTAGCSADG